MNYKNRWNISAFWCQNSDYFGGLITEINYKSAYEQMITFCFFIWMPFTFMCSVREKSGTCTFMCTFLYTRFWWKVIKIKRTEMSLTSSLFLPLITLHVVSLLCYMGNKMWRINDGGCRVGTNTGGDFPWFLCHIFFRKSQPIPSFYVSLLKQLGCSWVPSKFILATKSLGRS